MHVQGTDYLFPLDRVLGGMVGYYIDKEGQVYSTRGNSRAALARLAGSKPSTYGNRYYTLNGTSFSQPDLIQRAKAHSTFEAETSPLKVPSPVKTAAFPGLSAKASSVTETARSITKAMTQSEAIQAVLGSGRAITTEKAATVQEAIAQRGSIIASVTADGKFNFAVNPVVFVSPAALKVEMERLAHANPGTRFVQFTISGVVAAEVKPQINWS